jgi:hypothetical protein
MLNSHPILRLYCGLFPRYFASSAVYTIFTSPLELSTPPLSWQFIQIILHTIKRPPPWKCVHRLHIKMDWWGQVNAVMKLGWLAKDLFISHICSMELISQFVYQLKQLSVLCHCCLFDEGLLGDKIINAQIRFKKRNYVDLIWLTSNVSKWQSNCDDVPSRWMILQGYGYRFRCE